MQRRFDGSTLQADTKSPVGLDHVRRRTEGGGSTETSSPSRMFSTWWEWCAGPTPSNACPTARPVGPSTRHFYPSPTPSRYRRRGRNHRARHLHSTARRFAQMAARHSHPTARHSATHVHVRHFRRCFQLQQGGEYAVSRRHLAQAARRLPGVPDAQPAVSGNTQGEEFQRFPTHHPSIQVPYKARHFHPAARLSRSRGSTTQHRGRVPRIRLFDATLARHRLARPPDTLPVLHGLRSGNGKQFDQSSAHPTSVDGSTHARPATGSPAVISAQPAATTRRGSRFDQQRRGCTHKLRPGNARSTFESETVISGDNIFRFKHLFKYYARKISETHLNRTVQL